MAAKKMNDYISILCPTRERPAQMARFIKSIEENTFNKDTLELIVYIDEDDTSKYLFSGLGFKLKKIVGKRLSMGEYNTRCLEKAIGNIIVLLNDDVIVKTDCWDRLVRNIHHQYEDGVYLSYGNDLHKGRKISTFPILGRRTCELIAQPFPKEYAGALIDYHIFDVFKRIEKRGYHRIAYLPELIFEHMHFRAGKATADKIYQRRNRYQDDKVFINLSELRRIQAERLVNCIENMPFKTNKASAYLYKDSSVCESWINLFKKFAINSDLPFRWRIFLFVWLYARVLAGRGYLSLLGYNRGE
jgi:hypothetical protein